MRHSALVVVRLHASI